jgi:membrane-associated phospholipid phosphatase
VTLVVLLAAHPASAQTVSLEHYRVSWWDAASISAGAVLHFMPRALGLPEGPPSCVPCDPATLPGIDRWAVHPVSTSADVGSDLALIAVVGGTALAGLSGLPAEQWKGNLVVFANTATWTYATAEWIKVLVRRERPVMYTADAAAAAGDRTSQMSLPSGHTALAFAAATSYFVMAGRQHLAHRNRNAALLYAGAVGVGSLRVIAGKHFPTDVIAGAALGSAIGWLVPTIHPTSP